MKLDAKQLRDIEAGEAGRRAQELARRPIYLILEDVLDTYNIGGLFRLADSLGASKVFLCGEMETPPNMKIARASVGTYKIVPWEYCRTASEAIQKLRTDENYRLDGTVPHIIAVEQDSRAVDYRAASYTPPVAFIVGNETSGVAQETLDLCDTIVEIPMWGINKSLNVIVSAAIVAYHAASTLP